MVLIPLVMFCFEYTHMRWMNEFFWTSTWHITNIMHKLYWLLLWCFSIYFIAWSSLEILLWPLCSTEEMTSYVFRLMWVNKWWENLHFGIICSFNKTTAYRELRANMFHNNFPKTKGVFFLLWKCHSQLLPVVHNILRPSKY